MLSNVKMNFLIHKVFVTIMDLKSKILVMQYYSNQKNQKEFFALFCVLGSDRLDVNHKAKSLLGAKKVSFASREEAEIITNQIYGGISPLGLPEEIKVYIDENVMLRNKVFIGGGNRISKFFLKPSDLKDLTNGEVAELTQSIST